MNIFTEITIIVAIAAFISLIMRLLRQPLVVGYILTGIIVGPYTLNILQSTDQVELFSKIGITVLLFIVGLNLNPQVIKELGKVSLVTGVGQVLVTSAIGFSIALLLGIERIAAIYLSIALTLSSTIIILKLLSDRGDLNKLYGRIAIGFLIIQDLIASLILLFISTFSTAGDANLTILILFLVVKLLIVLCSLYLVSAYVIPSLFKFVAKSQELLFLFSLAWGLGLAVTLYQIGFSLEIGALIAGVTLSVTPYAYEIGSRLRPLRDFFIVLFFILLGSQMVLDKVIELIIPTLLFSVFVLIGNPVILILLLNLLGFKRRTSFMAGLTVAQISEFSLILASLGFSLGHISRDILSLITMVGLITITGSTYFILYSERIYPHVEGLLKRLQLLPEKKKEPGSNGQEFDCILFGYDRVGADFIKIFSKMNVSYIVVDYNPTSVQRLAEQNIPYRFGDAEDVEFLEELNLSKTKLVLSTIPDHKTNVLLTRKITRSNKRAISIIIAQTIQQAQTLYQEGATYVLMPHYLGARYASHMISRFGLHKQAYLEEKEKHIDHINNRLEISK
ncbi:MAG: Sodium/hydrogen exchanger [Microgenomates group bacterium GW2011_GWC1_41_8]|uniref:Sodium/hydrogen exchanger n=3 Tax=Candidatus Roizmaniibacteriota TaxID=1752723 RepID=A0A0G0XBP5_9BACT|nr:MAG: Sodium/hydrogen exchanger [Candidatus Levybacteria bacterium GW2011_GWA2_40_16]KKR72074.1 MAG: Sodium/hydrogen exchanger [Candidatus Roizmanbacteria bacterium GW2011_GWB1_40_7]KKR94381.1 MAG: Sodium/hydrogen exchanger [Candidatus Roizmanbacteria bacterium GW2011_GWA1_41_13]KKS22330.1 MAG: Sodium/hydrogen exchanger [Candidatus Roizmanbacteria bacterium GW2011_GWC2_41_7]KKS24454.1 MAG: Sodium/hydrogen exchanger [Microgenomates group bacterium GW2011_GWC1_41_8]OGK47952.1 MAG: sodium:proto